MSFSVIIPSRNDANLNACVDAIRAAGETCRIIVVDDGLATRRTDCEYVDGVKPFVYARNINIGIRAAGNDDVFLLNDDALFQPGSYAISCLHNRIFWNEGFGIIGAVTNLTGQPLQRPRQGESDYFRDVEHIAFVGVYIPRSTIDAVGLLDERYVGYGCDDRDYCLAVRKAGLKVGVFDGCYLDHASLTSTYRGHPEAPGDFSANFRLLIEKWGEIPA